jgi:hypothetical protein
VVAELVEPTQRVASGHEAVFTLALRNDGPSPDRLAVEVLGDAAAWAVVEPSTLDLSPGTEARATIRLRPPLGPDGPAGIVDVGIAVRSVERPGSAILEFGVLEVEPAPPVGAVTAAGAPGADAPAPVDSGAATDVGSPAPGASADVLAEEPPERTGRRRPPPALVAVAVVVFAAVAAVAVLAGSGARGPGSSPAAVATPSPVATPTPGATPSATATVPPSPSPAPTLVPPPTPDPGAPVAWWQDAFDAAADRGAVLGAAVAEGTTDDNLPYAEFANGSIVQRVYDAYWLSDEIWLAWKALGGGPGPAQLLGYPASTVLGPDLAQRRQLFDDGAVYWAATTGAHVVHGPVWDWWRALVGERGGDVGRPGESGLIEPLGHPMGDVQADATGAWIGLEAGMIGVTAAGERWACAYADPASGFPPCAELRTDPRWTAPSGAPVATPAP